MLEEMKDPIRLKTVRKKSRIACMSIPLTPENGNMSNTGSTIANKEENPQIDRHHEHYNVILNASTDSRYIRLKSSGTSTHSDKESIRFMYLR